MNDWVKAIVTRDAVSAADDLVERRVEFRLHAGEGVGRLIQAVRRLGFLPPIAGEEATWVLYAGRKPICVISQRDERLRFVADAYLTVGEIPKSDLGSARFTYCAQRNPELVCKELQSGRELELV